MPRFSIVLAALALVAPASAFAAEPAGPFYSATFATAPSKTSLIVNDHLWKCDENGCASAKPAKSRPAVMCQGLTRKLGTITAFRAGSENFDAAALAKCNGNG
ncbi:CC_3452 family protein [Sphingomonas sp. C3-2]|uniref:CC_3452 family protein n=1 Tax=Sphingomonas sp. C3-2 TaxID=3062169 RepID=UPI00294AC930|nr:hypothetical protein [Sphingomonas sp. C3-2]WOK38202.1 hypothetical protein QYC26_08540 [Sphingomonas sp. C3-2]